MKTRRKRGKRPTYRRKIGDFFGRMHHGGRGPCRQNDIRSNIHCHIVRTTRVGEGPFPTELTDDIGELLGSRGKEFGTVTSRKRRCGWFDGVLVRQTIKISGIDGIALTKLDVLDELDEIKMCVECFLLMQVTY